jgi:hypothetical protein
MELVKVTNTNKLCLIQKTPDKMCSYTLRPRLDSWNLGKTDGNKNGAAEATRKIRHGPEITGAGRKTKRRSKQALSN